MAREDTNSIIIEFEGRTVKFDESVGGATKAVKLLQKEINKLNKEMDIDGESTGKLSQVFEKITRQIEVTRQKIELIKKEMDTLAPNGIYPTDKKDRQKFEALAKELVNTETELAKLQQRAQHVKQALDDFDKIQAEKKLKEIGEAAKTVGSSIEHLGRNLRVFSGISQAALTSSINAAKDFESAFTGVQKTVDETAFTSYDKLEQTIRRMATELPTSAAEIAKVMEVAGQLGVKADDIEKFTKTIIDLSNATNIVGDEGAMALAQYFNIMQSNFDNVDRFGAALTELGNNSATTEDDILRMSKALAAAAHNIGLTDQEVLGMATALASLGLSAERGGSSISTILRKVDQAVGENSATVKEWAKITGMSVEEFTNAWNTNTMDTISKMIVGLGNLSEAEQNFYSVLSDLDISNIRQIDSLSRLVGAEGMMTEYVNMANRAWEENIALTTEANRRYGTTESQIQILKNNITEIGITLGETLLPLISKLVSDAKPLIKSIQRYVDKNGEAVASTLAFAAAMSPVLIGVGRSVKGMGELAISVSKYSKIARESEGITRMVANVMGGTSKLGLYGAIAAVVLGLGALVHAWGEANTQSTQFKKKQEELATVMKEMSSDAQNQYSSYVNGMSSVQGYIDKVNNLKTALENEQLTEEQQANVKKQIAQYIDIINQLLGDSIYYYDEATNAISRQGEKVNDLKNDYQSLQEELKKNAWLKLHADEFAQAVDNEQVGYSMMTEAVRKYNSQVSDVDYSNLNIPPQAMQYLLDYASNADYSADRAQNLINVMDGFNVPLSTYSGQFTQINDAQRNFNDAALQAHQIISDNRAIQEQYNAVQQNGTSAINDEVTALGSDIEGLRTRRTELEQTKTALESMGDFASAENIQLQIDKINEKIQRELEGHDQYMLNAQTEKDTALTNVGEVETAQTEATSRVMTDLETKTNATWQNYYTQGTTKAQETANYINGIQLNRKELWVDIQLNDPFGVFGGSGFPTGFGGGGSGGFAGENALRQNYINSGGFGDITINNSFTTGGTPSQFQLKQWGRVIANQVNQELGKKVRR